MRISQLKRREFKSLLGATAAWPLAARSQQGERMRRIGALIPLSANDPQTQTRNAAFLQGLRQLGWTVGHNVQIKLSPTENQKQCREKKTSGKNELVVDAVIMRNPGE
jgi:hypothetical protein